MSTVLSRRRFAHGRRLGLSALSTARCRIPISQRMGAPLRPHAARESEHGCCADRTPATCAVRHSAEFSSRRRRMDSAPSPNRPDRTENYRRPRTKGMGCEVEGRACSRGRAVVNTTPHGSPSRADPGLVRPRLGKTAPLQAGHFFACCVVRTALTSPQLYPQVGRRCRPGEVPATIRGTGLVFGCPTAACSQPALPRRGMRFCVPDRVHSSLNLDAFTPMFLLGNVGSWLWGKMRARSAGKLRRLPHYLAH
jgi:hypothetical protein